MPKYAILKYRDDAHGNLHHMEHAEAGYIDGYLIAERQLEGLPIKITVSPDRQSLVVGFGPDGEAMLKSSPYSQKKIGKMVLDRFVSGGIDILSSTEAMDDDDIVIYDYDKGAQDQWAYFTDTDEIPPLPKE